MHTNILYYYIQFYKVQKKFCEIKKIKIIISYHNILNLLLKLSLSFAYIKNDKKI